MAKSSSEKPTRERPATGARASAGAGEGGGLHDRTAYWIGCRISHALVERAKMLTGIEADADLIEFALANIAPKDDFAESFRQSRGKVDPDLELGFG